MLRKLPIYGRSPICLYFSSILDHTNDFSERLKVWMLPTILIIQDGVVISRLEGFTSLGDRDDFTTKRLDQVLLSLGAYARGKENHDDE